MLSNDYETVCNQILKMVARNVVSRRIMYSNGMLIDSLKIRN